MEIITSIIVVLLIVSIVLHVHLWGVRDDLERRLESRTEERDAAWKSRDERDDVRKMRLKQLARLVPDVDRYLVKTGLFDRDRALDGYAIDRDIEALETADKMKRAAELRPDEGGAHGPGDVPAWPTVTFVFETEAVKEARAIPLPLFFVSRTRVPGSKMHTNFGLATVVGPKAGGLEGLRGTIILGLDWDRDLTPKQEGRAFDTLRRNRAKGARVIWPSGEDVDL